jgi:hypothetical protein
MLCAAVALCWPAFLNHYPLIFPDSVSYLGDGRGVARALFLHRPLGMEPGRSEFYSLGIFPFNLGLSPWPIVALNAALTAWVLWLVVRSLLPRATAGTYLLLVAGLSALTSVSWYVCFLMPDILGPLVYLAIYLLVFARETLSGAERWGLAVLALWGITAHATHLMLAMGLLLLLVLLWVLVRRVPALRGAISGAGLVRVALLIAVAMAAQMGLHAYLYRRPSLFGNHPPYLMARIIADGPGTLYLQQHCASLDWAICKSVGHLPDNDDDFLWTEGGVWSSADKATQQRLMAEEMPLVLATVRAYPRMQAARSWANFIGQIQDFGVNDFDNNDWMQQQLPLVIPNAATRYARSLQARSAVPTQRFTRLQRWIVIPAAVLAVVLLPWIWLRRRHRLLGLAVVVLPALVANALVTAVLSSSDSRYQARVIWLLPLLAALIAMDLLTARRGVRV